MTASQQKVEQYFREKAAVIEREMNRYLTADQVPPVLMDAMRYSLFAGGKRLRPVLLLAAMESLGKDWEGGLPAACAVEMIHTYSLIHDDLPAMDNDDYRRGKLTNHKVYGDAIAILAGDGLLTHAFSVLCRLPEYGHSAEKVAQLVKELSVRAGISGMVGGQAADLLAENRSLTLEELQEIHRHKTADLIVWSIRSGGILANAEAAVLKELTTYGECIGLAFQIQDDILDVVGDREKLGKRPGSDEVNNKATYPALLGLDASREELDRMVSKASEALRKAGLEQSILSDIANFIINRDY